MNRVDRFRNSLNMLVNILTLAALIAFATYPGSPIRAAVGNQLEQRARKRVINEQWSLIVDVPSRIGDSADEPSLVEFIDYQCPVCARQNDIIHGHFTTHGTGQIIYRHYPLRIHPRAEAAARAAICAEGQSQFGVMHDYLYTTRTWVDEPDWRRIAVAVGVSDVAAFVDCLDSDATDERLNADVALAKRLGIFATPSFVTRNGVHVGLMGDSIIDHHLSPPRR